MRKDDFFNQLKEFCDTTEDHNTCTLLVSDLMRGLFRFLKINYCAVLLRNHGFLKNKYLSRNGLIIGYDHSFEPAVWTPIQNVLFSDFNDNKIPLDAIRQEFMDMSVEVIKFQSAEYPRQKARIQHPIYVRSLQLNDQFIGTLCLMDNTHDPLSAREAVIVDFFIKQFLLILENKLLKEEINKVSMYDESSGLYSKTYFMDRLEAEFKSAQRFKNPLSVLFGSLYNFNAISDTHGRREALEAANYVVSEISHFIRSIDIITLDSENEFAILLPHTPYEGASVLARKLNSMIKEKTYFIDDHQCILTLIHGIAAYPDEDVSSSVELLNCAKMIHAQSKELEDKFSLPIGPGIINPLEQ
ncbi:MAG: GGDEF domain-containing protein [Candidatus Auribacterota bacterium]